ncbi:methyltransferase [Streptomyces sp. NBC_00829]|uniref:methyltransferase n=1 Tax=Streptomyces sp. NBC_00829 TaxID=2903679 RepID=UPI003870154C|nr:methyltransferase [Streptomyces sp. NBC_00829]
MTVDTQAAGTAIDLITGAWRTQATYAAARLRLPDLVASGHSSSGDLARATGTDEDIVRRLMRLLVLLGVFDSDGHGGYRTTPVSDLLRERPGTLREMCLLYGEEFYQAWGQAWHAFTTATPGFAEAHGQSLNAYLSDHQETADRFQRAMQDGGFVFDDIPSVFDFSRCRRVVDIGGGNGHLLSTVLAAAPESTGVLVDLPHAIPIARAYLADATGLDRVELIGRDMFSGPLPTGDVYLLSRVLGGWDVDSCTRLLRGLRAAMTEKSRLLVLDRVAMDDGTGPLAALWDLHLLMTNGGRQRTLDDFRSLLDSSGLAIERIAELPMEHKALVVSKAP